MSAAAPKLLYAAGVVRSASGIKARAARGFHVFRIDGYSWTTATVPGGERISSDPFAVGGRHWRIDLYPNGDDASKDHSSSISLKLRLHAAAGYEHDGRRARAQYKFSLLDAAGDAAYELPALESTFAYAAGAEPPCALMYGRPPRVHPEGIPCGHREFITREELERQRDVLLRDDRLAIRCDVGVVQMDKVPVAPRGDKVVGKHHRYSSDDDYDGDSDHDDDDSDGESRRRRQRRMDDSEFVRRCLVQNRRA